MKSRSEILKEKKKSKEDKPSAAERTVAMPKPDGFATCPECDSKINLKNCTEREDGRYECTECAAPIEGIETPKMTKEKTKEKESPKPTPKEETKTPPEEKNQARSGQFCSKCGSEWPLLKGELVKNCGHDVKAVDDPYKAEFTRKVGPSGTTENPGGLRTTGTPEITVSGNRVSITWGKMKFPVGEPKGFKYSDMEIGSHIITVELPPDADRVKAAKAILADLQKIAETAFEIQYKWYLDKLGVVAK